MRVKVTDQKGKEILTGELTANQINLLQSQGRRIQPAPKSKK